MCCNFHVRKSKKYQVKSRNSIIIRVLIRTNRRGDMAERKTGQGQEAFGGFRTVDDAKKYIDSELKRSEMLEKARRMVEESERAEDERASSARDADAIIDAVLALEWDEADAAAMHGRARAERRIKEYSKQLWAAETYTDGALLQGDIDRIRAAAADAQGGCLGVTKAEILETYADRAEGKLRESSEHRLDAIKAADSMLEECGEIMSQHANAFRSDVPEAEAIHKAAKSVKSCLAMIDGLPTRGFIRLSWTADDDEYLEMEKAFVGRKTETESMANNLSIRLESALQALAHVDAGKDAGAAADALVRYMKDRAGVIRSCSRFIESGSVRDSIDRSLRKIEAL